MQVAIADPRLRQNITWLQTVGAAEPLEAQKRARHASLDITLLDTFTGREAGDAAATGMRRNLKGFLQEPDLKTRAKVGEAVLNDVRRKSMIYWNNSQR